ncbi:hypothetical protein EL466_13230 [Enterococcus faecium]|nr:hypothetical protein [Enterococcus faecium]
MNLGKKLLIVCISFLFGIVAAIYLINPFIQKRETVNQEQQIERYLRMKNYKSEESFIVGKNQMLSLYLLQILKINKR